MGRSDTSVAKKTGHFNLLTTQVATSKVRLRFPQVISTQRVRRSFLIMLGALSIKACFPSALGTD